MRATRNKKTITDLYIKSLKPKDKEYKVSCGNSIILNITPLGTKSWRFRYTWLGKEQILSLGKYPDMGIAEARIKRKEAQALLDKGVNPNEERRKEKRNLERQYATTFELVAREWHEQKKSDWTEKTARRNLQVLESWLFPEIGSRPISLIDTEELIDALRKIEVKEMGETLKRAQGLAGQVFAYGTQTSRCQSNPALNLVGLFKKQAAKNRAAIVEPLAFGELLRAIWGYQGGLLTRLALRLLALTALRPGEVRHLEWAEVDLDNALISISAGKMKMRRGHVVPLSTQALDLLTKLKEAGGGYGTYVFPCEGNSRGVMSDNTLNAALRRLGYDTQEQHCAHGFRSTFSTMAHNSRKWQYEAIEAALSHMHGSDVAMIYNRSAYLAERKELMQWWADECDKMRESMGTYGKA